MEAHPDFKELLALFNANKVKYLIVGGYALAFYGVPRATGDIDILIQPTAANAKRVMASLKSFGFGSLELSESDFKKPDHVIQLGVPPVRVDILTSLTGVSWQKAFKNKARGNYDDVPVFYLGKEEFLTNKRATARKRDQADLEALGED